jgi:phosphohistidine swiveling domain-containing protein
MESINFPEITGSASLFVDLSKYEVNPPSNLTGNSLEISDESVFLTGDNTGDKPNPKIISWWQHLPAYKKKLWQRQISEALIYNRIRELGRWLTVKNVNLIKSALINIAESNKLNQTQNIYFGHLNDILNNRVDESKFIIKRTNYEQYQKYSFPNCLTSRFIDRATQTTGVSSGKTSGVLINQAMLDSGKYTGKSVVLYTEMLSPQLTMYFDKISGIVSNNGGMLSHLAIMARENKIPVVVGYSLADETIKLGDNVQIDGDSGNITLLV